MNLKQIWVTVCFLGGVAVSGYAQDIHSGDVPAAVKNTLNKAYPNATDIDWEKRGVNYEVSFDIGRVDHEMLIAPTGKILSQQRDIAKSALPASVTSHVKANYPRARIDDVERIESAGKISYEVDIDGTPDKTLWYSADGKLIKSVND